MTRQKEDLPTQSTLRSLLRYDPDTGDLYWLPRLESYFRQAKKSPRSLCNSWNSKWSGRPAFSRTSGGYKIGTVLGQDHKAHRVIWAMHYNEWPEAIDHVNGDKADNRLSNLRPATRSQNGMNKGAMPNNTSGHKGVVFDKRRKKWKAMVTANSKRVERTFADQSSAISGAIALRLAIHGIFARHE